MRRFDSVVQEYAIQHKCELVMQVHSLKKRKDRVTG